MKCVCLKPTVKHGEGSVMVWGCLTANCMSDLVRTDEIMNAEQNRQILIHYAIPSVKHLIGNDFIFQQDNDPKHITLQVKSYLERKEQSEMAFSKSRFEYHRISVGLFGPKKG